MATAMNVGKIISGSQLLQRAENIEYPTSARDRSKNQELSQTNTKSNWYEQKSGEPDKREAKELVDSLNKFLEPSYTDLKFEYHEKLEEYYVTIIDPSTNEVIKEVPPKKLLDVYASMAELLGFIVDEKV